MAIHTLSDGTELFFERRGQGRCVRLRHHGLCGPGSGSVNMFARFDRAARPVSSPRELPLSYSEPNCCRFCESMQIWRQPPDLGVAECGVVAARAKAVSVACVDSGESRSGQRYAFRRAENFPIRALDPRCAPQCAARGRVSFAFVVPAERQVADRARVCAGSNGRSQFAEQRRVICTFFLD